MLHGKNNGKYTLATHAYIDIFNKYVILILNGLARHHANHGAHIYLIGEVLLWWWMVCLVAHIIHVLWTFYQAKEKMKRTFYSCILLCKLSTHRQMQNHWKCSKWVWTAYREILMLWHRTNRWQEMRQWRAQCIVTWFFITEFSMQYTTFKIKEKKTFLCATIISQKLIARTLSKITLA